MILCFIIKLLRCVFVLMLYNWVLELALAVQPKHWLLVHITAKETTNPSMGGAFPATCTSSTDTKERDSKMPAANATCMS